MAIYYLDTSPLVKYYVPEPGSNWVKSLINSQDTTATYLINAILIGNIAIAETSAPLAILHRRGLIIRPHWHQAYERFMSDLKTRYTLVNIGIADYYLAAELAKRHPLKAYDAVHLALAIRQDQKLRTKGHSITFVTGDRTLLTAAIAEGLTTDNPFDHITPADTLKRS